ncbi:MAG: hypothetical protein GX678_07425 [Actinomycetales bacterium]|nr:hypothetical protein [Actinomycetales bacterium]
MFDFLFLGFNGLFWQVIFVVAVATVALLVVSRSASQKLALGAIAGWVVVMVPLVWLNWWLVPGNELLADDTAMPVSPEQLHYPSLVAIVAVSVIYVAAVRWLTHRSAASQVDAPSYSNAS